MVEGEYSYRFSGNAMKDGLPHYIVGAGILAFELNGRVTGAQSSSITRLTGSGATLKNAQFDLLGTYWSTGKGRWSARVTFTSLSRDAAGRPEQILTGTFDFVSVGDDNRFWMIATGAVNQTTGVDKPACEVISGEAVRLNAA